jgi:predicted NBD/HSP70 family sugar kinase
MTVLNQSNSSPNTMVDLDTRQRDILRLLWSFGRLSRWELHRKTGVNPNAVGVDVGALLAGGIVRECASEVAGPGRPRIPLEIDPTVRHVVGIAISPGRVEAGRLTLRGSLLGRPVGRSNLSDPNKTISAAQTLLRETLSDQTLAVGLSVTGFVDPAERAIITSSSVPGRSAVSLAPLYETVGNRPIILENNMHALAAWWLLIHQAEADEDVLLVSIRDGQLGAALLIDGRPNRGCAIGANELGHVRFFVETDTCYCGHPGCLERIVSTDFLRRRGVAAGTLLEHAARYGNDGANGKSSKANAAAEKAVGEVLDYLSAGLANATNFIRPNRLVLASELTRYPAFNSALLRSIRSRLLGRLLERVRIDLWDQVDGHSAETAGWLALASLYRDGWGAPVDVQPTAAASA